MPRPMLDGLNYESDEGDVLPLADIPEVFAEKVAIPRSAAFKLNRAVSLVGVNVAPEVATEETEPQAPERTAYDVWYDHVEVLLGAGLTRDMAIAQVTRQYGPEPADEPQFETQPPNPEEERLAELRERVREVRNNPQLDEAERRAAEAELVAHYRVKEERRHEFDQDYVYHPPAI